MNDTVTLSLSELHRFATDVLSRVGMPEQHARWTADGLLWADAHGLPAHGVQNKLVQCVERIHAGGTVADPKIRVTARRTAHEAIDAADAWGHVAGTMAMHRAIDLSLDHGLAAVSVCNSSSAAAMGYFAGLAADRGCVGLAVTNGPALIAAPGGTRRVVGNQGHALAAPGEGDERVLYDSATTTMSTGRMDRFRERGGSLPEGVLRDGDGNPTTDPALWTSGLLEPIGGQPLHARHRSGARPAAGSTGQRPARRHRGLGRGCPCPRSPGRASGPARPRPRDRTRAGGVARLSELARSCGAAPLAG